MRAMITVFAAALLLAMGCAKKDDTSVMPAPADQPTDTAPATPPSPAPADPNADMGQPPPSDESTTTPPSEETPPPQQ